MINYECKECGQALAMHGIGALTGFTFVNGAIINRELPESAKVKPLWNQYYNSGSKPFGENPSSQTGLSTYYNDVGSFFHILGHVTKAAFCNLEVACCCCPPKY